MFLQTSAIGRSIMQNFMCIASILVIHSMNFESDILNIPGRRTHQV